MLLYMLSFCSCSCVCVCALVSVAKGADWTYMFHSFSLRGGSTTEKYPKQHIILCSNNNREHTRGWYFSIAVYKTVKMTFRDNFCQSKPLQKSKHNSHCSPRGWFVREECGWYLHFIKKKTKKHIASSRLTRYLLGKWRRSAFYPPPTLVKSEQLWRWS